MRAASRKDTSGGARPRVDVSRPHNRRSDATHLVWPARPRRVPARRRSSPSPPAPACDKQKADTIHACARKQDGRLRVVAGAANCKRGERAMQWNVEGPQGPAGAQGPAGTQGPAGARARPAGPAGGRDRGRGPSDRSGLRAPSAPAGAIGPAGAAGGAGPVGPAGPAGAQGATGPQGPAGARGPAGTGIDLARGSQRRRVPRRRTERHGRPLVRRFRPRRPDRAGPAAAEAAAASPGRSR